MNKKLFVLVFVSLFCFSLTSAAIKDFNVESSGSSRLFVNGTTGLVRATAEYPYLVKSFVSGGDILNAKMEIINNLPLNLDGSTSLNNFDKSEKIVLIKGGVIFNTTIPKDSLGGNNFLLRKCLSNVNITRDSDLAILNNCLSVEPKDTFLISCPCFINNLVTSVGKFSSERNFNLSLEENIFFFSDEFRSICHNREDGGFCEGRKIISKNLVDANTCSEQFQNLPNHDSCSFKGRSSTTNFTIHNNIIINFDSHNPDNSEDYLKLSNGAEWIKVSELREGMEIAAPDSNGGY